MTIRDAGPGDLPRIRSLVAEHFGSSRVVSRGRLYELEDLVLVVLAESEVPLGVLGYVVRDDELEVVVLVAAQAGRGIGTRLLDEARTRAEGLGCRRMWLVTTNDNVPAMRFYRRWGLQLATVHRDAVERSRQLKPEIPERGYGGTPIRDELEFEYILRPDDNPA